jgi:hypothetical protein
MWTDLIDEATLNWLLEKNNPSVRYLTQTKLLGLGSSHPEVVSTKMEIGSVGLVPKILNQQMPGGFWGEERSFYHDKYKGTVWQLLLLAEMCADPEDERIIKACNFILDASQDSKEFGFSVHYSSVEKGGRQSEVIPCLTGNMVFSLIKLGFLADERVQKAIDWICRYQRCDDGVSFAPAQGPYGRFESCWGKHTCFMGVAKALKALSAIPVEERSDAVEHKIQELVEFLLIHHIYHRSHDLERVSRPGWLKFGFPLMYQTDVLELLEMLTELGCRDERMQDAVQLVRSKQQADNRWTLENTFNGRMLHQVEVKGAPSKWITFRAVNALSNFQKQP